MILPDMEKVKLSSVQGRSGLIARDELRFFGEVVDHGEDRVEAVGKGEISDEVCANVHPRHRAWLKWDSCASRLRVASFEVSAPITVGDVGFDVSGQPGPIVVVFNEFLGFLITRVTGDGRVVVRSDDLHAQRIVVGNIHPTGGIIEEAVSFFADSFLFA